MEFTGKRITSPIYEVKLLIDEKELGALLHIFARHELGSNVAPSHTDVAAKFYKCFNSLEKSNA